MPYLFCTRCIHIFSCQRIRTEKWKPRSLAVANTLRAASGPSSCSRQQTAQQNRGCLNTGNLGKPGKPLQLNNMKVCPSWMINEKHVHSPTSAVVHLFHVRTKATWGVVRLPGRMLSLCVLFQTIFGLSTPTTSADKQAWQSHVQCLCVVRDCNATAAAAAVVAGPIRNNMGAAKVSYS